MAPASSDPQDPAEAGAPDVLAPPPPPPVPPARYRISAPGPVSGGVMGVAFANGQAVVDDAVRYARALAWFRLEPGYTVTEIDPPDPVPADEPEQTADDDPAAEPTPDVEDATDETAPAATVRRRK